MTSNTIEFIRFFPKEALAQDFEDLITLLISEFVELNPKDPVPSREQTRRNIETVSENTMWNAEIALVKKNDGEIIGWIDTISPKPNTSAYEERKHMAFLNMFLKPEMRRQGIGKQMLQFVVNKGLKNNWTIVEGGTSFPSGQAFAEKCGAIVGLEETISRAYLVDIDWEMMQDWVKSGQERNLDTRIIEFDDWHSEDETGIKKYCALISSIYRDVPSGNLEKANTDLQPEEMRNEVENDAKQNFISTYFVIEEADGRFTGVTKINYRTSFGHYRCSQFRARTWFR